MRKIFLRIFVACGLLLAAGAFTVYGRGVPAADPTAPDPPAVVGAPLANDRGEEQTATPAGGPEISGPTSSSSSLTTCAAMTCST